MPDASTLCRNILAYIQKLERGTPHFHAHWGDETQALRDSIYDYLGETEPKA